jgi:5-methylcytosine-specific restriction endonuclease McrA
VVEQKRREAVRRAYGRRCGYCGIHEEEAGSKLEVDHFRPRSAGGANELENLAWFIRRSF